MAREWTPEQEVRIREEAELGIIGDPLALGVAGFGLTLFVASVIWAGFFPEDLASFALPLAIVLGPITLIAGLWSYRRHDTFTATALGALGAFWLSWGALQWMLLADFLPTDGELNGLVGTFFLGWTVLVAILFLAALSVNLTVSAVLGGTALTFLFLTIGSYADDLTWTNIGGWIGIITAAVTGYAVIADIINSTMNRTVLPMLETRRIMPMPR